MKNSGFHIYIATQISEVIIYSIMQRGKTSKCTFMGGKGWQLSCD